MICLEKHQDWFRKSFGEYYPLVYHHKDSSGAIKEIEYLFEQLKLTGEEKVLDLCCGNGRHLEPILERGFSGYGIDLSSSLLEIAKSRNGINKKLVRADMRTIPCKSGSFDIVLNLFSSFGYFLDDNDNNMSLKEMARILSHRGHLVLDLINRSSLEDNLVHTSKDTYKNLTIICHRSIQNNRVIKEIEVITSQGKKACLKEFVRLYTPEEIRDMMKDCEINITKILGDYHSTEFNKKSPRMIVIGRKLKV